MSKIVNQQNPPLPKKKRVDSQGNHRYRVFAKSGNATLCIAKGLTEQAIRVITANLKDTIISMGGTVECTFITAR